MCGFFWRWHKWPHVEVFTLFYSWVVISRVVRIGDLERCLRLNPRWALLSYVSRGTFYVSVLASVTSQSRVVERSRWVYTWHSEHCLACSEIPITVSVLLFIFLSITIWSKYLVCMILILWNCRGFVCFFRRTWSIFIHVSCVII